MEIKKVAVVGAGTMGNGIAHVFAQSGFAVTLVDVQHKQLDRALGTIENNLTRMVDKEKITEADKSRALSSIATSSNISEGVQGVQLVVEAVNENFELKKKIFQNLAKETATDTILASNTSSISITKLGGVVSDRATNVIGMHFFNPVPVMKLVEIVSGLETSEHTRKAVSKLSEQLGKTPVMVQDAPGFVSNRVLMPMINEAAFCVHEGVATPEAVDEIMKLGMAHPMGPLRLADFIGLDVCLDILRVLYEGFGDSKYRPCPLLVKMVDAGKLGDKTGEGFYTY